MVKGSFWGRPCAPERHLAPEGAGGKRNGAQGRAVRYYGLPSSRYGIAKRISYGVKKEGHTASIPRPGATAPAAGSVACKTPYTTDEGYQVEPIGCAHRGG